jgi:sulfide dehydrogenase cytochrome subunit
MAKQTLRLALTGSALALGLAAGGVLAEGATGKMLTETCYGCHGPNGNSVGPASPSIAAMDPIVFVDTMVAFAEGDTYSTIMGRIAKGYTEDEFEKMGEFLHEQEYTPAKQEFDQSLVDAGADLHDKYCEKCHIEGGKPVPEEEDYYILAGQWTPYLKYRMEDFGADRSEMPKKMRKKYDRMIEREGEEGMAKLYAFYAAYTDFGSEDDDE